MLAQARTLDFKIHRPGAFVFSSLMSAPHERLRWWSASLPCPIGGIIDHPLRAVTRIPEILRVILPLTYFDNPKCYCGAAASAIGRRQPTIPPDDAPAGWSWDVSSNPPQF
jgi:hypothetical protein